MSSQISAPLVDIIKRATQLPGVNQREIAAKERLANASEQIAVLVDVSGSMWDPIGVANICKWQHAKIAVEDILRDCPKVRIVAFSSGFKEVRASADLPGAGGGTDLAGAFNFIGPWRPRKTIVVSDGIPDDTDAALVAARRLTGVIDTIYCGPDGHPAISFLRSLNPLSGGHHTTWEGARELSTTVRGLIAAPKP